VSKKVLLVVAVLVLALGGASIAAADDGGETYEGCFRDGRLNGCDVAAPIAVYGEYTDVEKTNDADETYTWPELDGVAIWAIGSDGAGYLDLYVTAGELDAALATSGEDWGVVYRDGYQLVYTVNGDLQVTAPDGYSFTTTID
jgi:hypothetical protein